MRRPLALFLALVFAVLLQGVAPAHASPFSARHGKTTSDPVGVTLNGLNAVYHLKATNGARVATANSSVYSMPSGATYQTGNLSVDLTGSTALSAINNAAKGGFYWVGTGTSSLTDATLTANSGTAGAGITLAIGETSGASQSGAPIVDIEHCSADFSGGAVDSKEFQTFGVNHLTVGFCNFTGAPNDYIVTSALGGTIDLLGDYFGAYGQNATGPAHLEWMHWQGGGTHTVKTSRFDASDGIFPTGGISGGFQMQTGIGFDPTTYTGGAGSWTFHGDVITFGSVINQVIWSGKAVFADVDIYVDTSTFDHASTASYATCNNQADITVGSVVGTFSTAALTLTATGKSAAMQGGLTGGNNLHLTDTGGATGARFIAGDAVTQSSSGATATVTAVAYHTCTIHDAGGNKNFAGATVTVP